MEESIQIALCVFDREIFKYSPPLGIFLSSFTSAFELITIKAMEIAHIQGKAFMGNHRSRSTF